MAKRVAGVTEKLMEAAKQEFLKNGYERASLQTIAEKAGSSKGAIYIRYPDKESLYRSLVQPAMDDFCGMIQSALQQFNQLPWNRTNQSNSNSFSVSMVLGFCRTISTINFDEFKLLLTSWREQYIIRNFSTGLWSWTTNVTMRLYSGIQERRKSPVVVLRRNWAICCPAPFIPECSRWSSMICQRIRRLSISKGCGVSTPPGEIYLLRRWR